MPSRSQYGAGDEGQFRPACRTKRLAFDRFATGGAQRRQSEIERRAQHRAHGIGGAFDLHGQSHAGRRHHGATLSRYDKNVIVQKKVMTESPVIFDRTLLRDRRRRAATLGPVTFLLDRAADDLADRLAAVLRRFDLGGRSWHAGRSGAHGVVRSRHGRHGRENRGNTAGGSLALTNPSLLTKRHCRSATTRSISSCRHWRCNSSTICPARSLQIRRALKPDGLFLAALIGGETLSRAAPIVCRCGERGRLGASPASLPSPICASWAPCCSAPDGLPVTDVDRLTVRYRFRFSA